MKSPMTLAMYCAQNFRAFSLAMLMCCSATAQDAQPPLDMTQAPDNQAVQKQNRLPLVKPNKGNVNIDGAAQMLNARRNAGGGFGDRFQERAIVESMSRPKLASVQPPPELLALLTKLDDPSFAVRQAASQKLLDPSFSDPSLWAVLDRLTLSEEARGRLLAAACRRVLERPRGALGIRMGAAPLDRPGVVIQATLVGIIGS